jgi:hypothetical protein
MPGHDKHDNHNHHADKVAKVASQLAVGALAGRMFETHTAEGLADYCLLAATRLLQGDIDGDLDTD